MGKFTHFARLRVGPYPSHTRTGGTPAPCAGWEPAVDIFDRAGDIVVVVELPGCDAEQFRVSVENNELIIKGVRSRRVPEGVRGVLQLEIPHGEFVRQIRLGPGFSRSRIKAEYADGFLTIVLPRRGA